MRVLWDSAGILRVIYVRCMSDLSSGNGKVMSNLKRQKNMNK
jgi:hypothetical protein